MFPLTPPPHPGEEPPEMMFFSQPKVLTRLGGARPSCRRCSGSAEPVWSQPDPWRHLGARWCHSEPERGLGCRESISSVSRGPGPCSRRCSQHLPSVQHAGKCSVPGDPKMQTLQQKCPSFGGACNQPGLGVPPPGTEKPPALPAGRGLAQEEVKRCAQEHSEQRWRRRERLPGRGPARLPRRSPARGTRPGRA